MSEKVLISTFGFESDKIITAIRELPFERLVLVMGKDALKKPGFIEVKDLCDMANTTLNKVYVDVFNFMDCFKKITSRIEKEQNNDNIVSVNASGGTKVLGDAAILGSFHCGVQAYHCEDDLVELPVFLGVRFEDRFTEDQQNLLKLLSRPRSYEEIRDSTLGIRNISKSMNELKRRGLVDEMAGPVTRYGLSREGKLVKRYI